MSYKNFIPALLLSAVILTACNNQPQSAQTDIASPVSVLELKPGSISKLINTTGTSQPTYGVELTSQISGSYKLQTNPATGKPFKLGDRVSKNQVVIRLEDKEYENGIALDVRELNLQLAEQESIKQDSLYAKGGITLFEKRNSEVKVTNARHDIESAKLNIDKMEIKSPFNGVIVNLPHYSTDVKIAQNQPVLGIMDYSQMYMDINLPESAIEYVKQNQEAKITHYTLPNDTLMGVISELSPAINTETRTFKGKILIQNKELKLRPGMFVKADIVVDRSEDALIIPKEVIQANRRRKFVYVVEKNTAILRDIKTGLEDENYIEITSGLNENDNLIIKGYETLRENSKVKIQK
jgi:RND family efflux transporter MFP subunit